MGMAGRDGGGMGWDERGWDGGEGKGSGEGNKPILVILGTVVVRHVMCIHNMPRCMKLKSHRP